jgi:redox-sensitive bicupin YhaK (pirin superfamily)
VNAEPVTAGELAVFDRKGNRATIAAQTDAIVFVMNGAPIDEPIAGYGPFVMNTPQEIQQAFADYHAGRLGTLPTTERTTS